MVAAVHEIDDSLIDPAVYTGEIKLDEAERRLELVDPPTESPKPVALVPTRYFEQVVPKPAEALPTVFKDSVNEVEAMGASDARLPFTEGPPVDSEAASGRAEGISLDRIEELIWSIFLKGWSDDPEDQESVRVGKAELDAVHAQLVLDGKWDEFSVDAKRLFIAHTSDKKKKELRDDDPIHETGYGPDEVLSTAKPLMKEEEELLNMDLLEVVAARRLRDVDGAS